MHAAAHQNQTAAPHLTHTRETPTLRGFDARRLRDRHAALGLAVEYLGRMDVFKPQEFGPWTRTLIGQIARGHYFFVFEGVAVRGYAGWGRCSHEDAEAWLAKERHLSSAECRSGPVLLINVIAAEDREAVRYINQALRKLHPDVEQAVGRRQYLDGRSRPVRVKGPASGPIA